MTDLAGSLRGEIKPYGLIIAFLGGGSIQLFGGIFNMLGSYKGKNLAVQSVRYLTPAAGVAFLIIFSPLASHVGNSTAILDKIKWDWFTIGFIGVLTVVAISKFTTEIGKKLTVLILSFWTLGALFFLREQINPWHHFIEEVNISAPMYFFYLALLIILIAFLVYHAYSVRCNKTMWLAIASLSLLGLLAFGLYPPSAGQAGIAVYQLGSLAILSAFAYLIIEYMRKPKTQSSWRGQRSSILKNACQYCL